MSKKILAGALGALAFTMFAAAAFAAPPPAAFGRREAIQSAALSPNGQQIALISGTAYERSLSIATIDKPNPVLLSLGDVRTSGLRWAGDGFVLVTITRYEKPVGLKHAYNFTRDLIFDTRGKLKGWVLDSSPESGLMTGLPIQRVIHGDKPAAYVEGLDANVKAASNNTRFAEDHSIVRRALWKVDIASGRSSVAERSEAIDWAIDAEGGARGKLDPVESVNERVRYEERPYTVFGRGRGQSGWKALATVKRSGVGLLGYSGPEDALYWWQEDGDKGVPRIHKITFKDGARTVVPTPEPAIDVNMIFDPTSDEPLAVTYVTNDGAKRYKWLDPKFASAHASLGRLFKGKTVDIESWSADRARFIVRVWSGDAPASWYLYDPGRKEVSALGEEYPELKGSDFAKKTYFSYKARDGLTIPAYLHMPANSTGKNLPLIVLPHGGPASRDYDDFDYEAQFLASRGYAVLQPQFRGSDGFGFDFREAGRQEWAGKMQLDLVDGVSHLASQGVIDAKRVCIVGSSYGGYAALYGMTSLPDVYRCGVSINGVSDPGQLVVQLGRRFGGSPDTLMLDTFGDNRKEVAAGSPAENAANAKGPILLIYSAEDTTVPPEQTTFMADRLKAAGKSATVVLLPGDDHHLHGSASRIQALTAMEAFLAKNLPVSP